ncbi:MAG: hypothetical protein ABIS06_08490 [Vicinamibacterales bacterium]
MTNEHLDDAALAAIWTGSLESGETDNDPHLLQCAECRVRYGAFVSWMNDIRAEALSEAEEAFPAERLVAQQAQILRRIEAAERPARVIAFPNATSSVASPRSSVGRWVAAALAAGLIAGVGIGRMMNMRDFGAPQRFPSTVTVAAPRLEPRPAVVPASAMVSEETLLADLEAASTPRYDTLRAFDAFTPHAADFVKSR